MKIIATISGTPSATLRNAISCPGWAARSAWPRTAAVAKPSKPAMSARSTPTDSPSSRRDAQARAATSAMLVASTATVNTSPLTGDDSAASTASSGPAGVRPASRSRSGAGRAERLRDLLDRLGLGGTHALPVLLVSGRDLVGEGEDEAPVVIAFLGGPHPRQQGRGRSQGARAER